jgi:phospho-N-acetylmuramoyl-pentapeptide-transferase
MQIDTLKILIPTAVAFCAGIIITPILTHFLYKYKMWKKTSVQTTMDGHAATISSKLHNDEERKTPRMGGVVIWGSTLITTLLFFISSEIFPNNIFAKFNFLSRNQTWLPLFTLIAGALCGLADDYLVCQEKGTYSGGGLSLRMRILFVAFLGLIGGYWFYAKLGMTSVLIPFFGNIEIGLLIIPLFILFIIGIYSGGIIDGVDGLSGGVFASIFSAYAVIAFTNNQIDLATFCSVVTGGLLAFLWFNIPPARFFNSETGTMGLTTALVVVAFLTNAIVVLPIIALLLVMTSLSSIVQIYSKKLRGGKKVFLVAPLHNHFQAKGWPPYKVTMRYWVLSMVFAVLGVIIHLVGKVI